MDEKLEKLCSRIASGNVEDKDLLALSEAIAEAIEKGHFPIKCGVPVADAVSKKKRKD
jgi:hypothetical protein